MVRLRRSRVAAPGFTRCRRGKGFSYLDSEGKPVDREHAERIRTLVIPPAWRELWICPWPNGHIQAVGVDDAGRKQYLYHDEWRRQRDQEKYDRVLELAPTLPGFRKAITENLTRRRFDRTRTLAVGLRMLDHGVFRTGGDQYLEQHGSHGVATLLRDHVTVRGKRVSFDYQAKGGVRQSLTLVDLLLAKTVAGLKRTRSDSHRLLVYREDGEWHEVHAEDVNQGFHELVGDEYTVKDLRTWNATVLAAAILASAKPTRRAVGHMYRDVSEHLGNTPAVARKSYVDPRLVDLFERGTTIRPDLERIGSDDLARTDIREQVERAVYELLTDA